MRVFRNLKQTLRAHRNSPNPIVRHGITSMRAAYQGILVGKTFFTDATYRSIVLLQLLRARHLHQTTTITEMDRYPVIFSACREYFGDRRDLKILSFGCSTGEEVLTLRRYFPSVFITGAEINRRSLSLCRKLKVDDRIAFVFSSRAAIRAHGPFDAIFCMAVLQRTPHTIEAEGISSLKQIYPFEKFDRQVSELDLTLRTGGLLVIHHTQYLFDDASVATKYEPLAVAEQKGDDMPRFDRNSQRVQRVASGSVFVKIRS